jgi:hypothetical protein
LLEFVTSEVVDGKLTLKVTENIRPTKNLEFEIVTDKLSEAEMSGAAVLKVDSIDAPELRLATSGAGKIQASGKVDRLDVDVSGAANIEAAELMAKTVSISISGTGSADVYASDSLDASISGAGRINCLGKPAAVAKSVSGVGKINVPE